MSSPLNHKDLEPLCQKLTDEVNNGGSRHSIIQAAQSIVHAAQDEQQLYVHFAVNKCEIIVMRLFLKWEAFQEIPLEGSISFADLAHKLDADVNLISRLTRLLIATGLLSSGPTSSSQDNTTETVSHTPRSRPIAADPLFRSTMKLILFEDFPQAAGTPEYYERYGRAQAPSSKLHTPYAFAKGQHEKRVFEIMNQNQELLKIFMQAMTKTQEFVSEPQGWYGDFSWAVDGEEKDVERVQLVDVGGGAGHTLQSILSSTLGLDPQKCVLQDRPEVVNRVAANDGVLKDVKKMGIDFHTGQPVEGAKAYLLRRCLHDYGDEECVNILEKIQRVMRGDSRVLIVEMVLVPGESPPFCYAVDMAMMGISGKERTLREWEGIAALAGLRVDRVVKATGIGLSVLECVKV